MRSAGLAFVAFSICASTLRAADNVDQSTHMVPMHDGVKLSTVVYRPADAKGPMPVVLARGPYGKFQSSVGKSICDKGYILVSQDMRGRHDSEGSDAIAFGNDGWGKNRDGQETIEWIAKQSWCNGKVATW